MSLKDNRDEDRVWRTLVEPHLTGLRENVFRICQYGFTEIFKFERFKEVFLDFSAVESIGQAFADEIFRVYATGHPEMKLTAVNANDQVTRMIRRATAAARER